MACTYSERRPRLFQGPLRARFCSRRGWATACCQARLCKRTASRAFSQIRPEQFLVLAAKRRRSNAPPEIDPAVHVTRAVVAVPGSEVMPKFVDRHHAKRFGPVALTQILETICS